MDFRKYSAELVGSFLFFTIGYYSVGAFHATDPATPGLLVVPFSFVVYPVAILADAKLHTARLPCPTFSRDC